jgi:hypothetical protein
MMQGPRWTSWTAFITSNQKGAKSVGNACRSSDWIPKELQELVDLHGPKESDMDLEGYLNKMRLLDEARKLFTELKTKHLLCNFYQFQQAVKHFGDSWGFIVSTQNTAQMVCFYANSSRKKEESLVLPVKNERKLA